MHKIFAKPLFLGKKVVFLPQCHSTNDELSLLEKNEKIPEGTIVYTDHQTSGRGQRGNNWMDEDGKSILCSILLKPKELPVAKSFLLNVMVGVSLMEMLKEIKLKAIKLKWPNDIYLGQNKLAGVLIENSVRGNRIDASVVGIGLNVNQEYLPIDHATSLYKETQTLFDRYDLIEKIIVQMEFWYRKLMMGSHELLLATYHDALHWKDELRTFSDKYGYFNGIIRGIDHNGSLEVERDGEKVFYGLKEIQFIQ